MLEEFAKRINLNTELNNISKEICSQYNLGEYISDRIIEIGYEDFNYILEAESGKYCVKVFNKERTDKECKQYIDRIKLATTLDINTPKIYSSKKKDYLITIKFENTKYRLCVTEYITGKSFYDLGIKPNYEEMKEIIRQMVDIHKTMKKPNYIYDKWTITNFKQEFEDKAKYLDNKYLSYFEELEEKYKKIDIQKLPHCFIHGDIITSNIIKDKNNKLWLIDFGVSNYLPRIIDLVVSACDLCLELEDVPKTALNIKMLIEEYEKYSKLTEYEKQVFPIFFDVVNAIGILQMSYIIKIGKATEEDKISYYEYEKGLELSNSKLWGDVFKIKE